MLQARGATVMDADLLVHELYSDPQFSKQIAASFGEGVLNAGGTVNRKALGAIVFQNADALKKLEALVHPAVAALRSTKLAVLRNSPQPPPPVVVEAVKLIESGQARGCDAVWCVVSTPEIQLQRLIQSRGLDEGQARERLAAQPSREAKLILIKSSAPGVPLAFLENNGTTEELERRVENLWQRFLTHTMCRAG